MKVAGRPSIVVNAGRRLEGKRKEAFTHTYLTDLSRTFEKERIQKATIASSVIIIVGSLLAILRPMLPQQQRPYWLLFSIVLIIVGTGALLYVRRAFRQDKRLKRIRADIGSRTKAYDLNGHDLHMLREACGDSWQTYVNEIIIGTDVGLELTARVRKFIRDLEKPILFERKLDGNREKARKDEIKALAAAAADDMNEIYIDTQSHDDVMRELRKLLDINAQEAETRANQQRQSVSEAGHNRLFDAAFGKGERLTNPRVINE
jgi:hypothetical protein